MRWLLDKGGISLATKLYLHNALSSLSNLPSDEQSSQTPDADLFTNQALATNRLMDKTIGGGQVSSSRTTDANQTLHRYYICRWVSPKLNQNSINANTWTYNFAAQQSNANANFPCSGTNVVWVNIYIWRTSNSSKIATILDGNSASSAVEPSAGAELSIETTFSGSAASNLNIDDDCIVFEMWFNVTQGMSVSYTDTLYWDGTTEIAGNGNATSNHASFISTPENIAFMGESGPVDCSVTGKIVTNKFIGLS